MGMHEYLERLSEQIRCLAARPAVEEEIRSHIEDQAKAYEAGGMCREEALKKSVEQMGDPVEAGVALDRIHRPKTEWSIVILILILSAAGLAFQAAMAADAGIWGPFFKRVLFTGLGLAVMCAVYRMDYSALGKYPLQLWFGMFLIWWFFIPATGTGALDWIDFPIPLRSNGQTHIYSILLMFIPLYAGVLYYFRKGGYLALMACALFPAFPMYVAGLAVQTTAAIEIAACSMALLFAAVMKGWFLVNKGLALTGLTAGTVSIPLFLIFFGEKTGFLLPYQSIRIQAFLHMGDFQTTANYLRAETVNVVRDCTLFGNKTLPPARLTLSKALESDFAVTALFYYYGIVAGCLVLLLLGYLLIRACSVSLKQKNQLGMMTGLGCTLALGIQAVTYVLSNLGIGLLTQKTMPFFSAGGQGILVNYIFLGLLLSVYRYKDILPKGPEVKRWRPGFWGKRRQISQ